MKPLSLSIFLWIFILKNLLGQVPVDTIYQNLSKQELEQVAYKRNKFTVMLDMPGLFISGKNSWVESNILQSVGGGFDYNFSEIISLGLHLSYFNNHTKYTESKEESHHQTLNFSPVFKVNLGRNQMLIPFLEASYTLSCGKWYCNYLEEFYTKNYVRHIISGGIGVKIYASRWFKKTKYKNNFGIEFCISKAFFLFDNSINVPLLERDGMRFSFFYRF